MNIAGDYIHNEEKVVIINNVYNIYQSPTPSKDNGSEKREGQEQEKTEQKYKPFDQAEFDRIVQSHLAQEEPKSEKRSEKSDKSENDKYIEEMLRK